MQKNKKCYKYLKVLKSTQKYLKVPQSTAAIPSKNCPLCRFLGGKGTMAQFNKEWQDLGLNKEQAAHVRKAIIKRS